MKKVFFLLAVLVASSSHAQTAADVLAAANSAVCEKYSLASGCTDAAVLTAYCTANNITPCVDSRTAADKIYATAASFAAAVLLPPKQAEVFAARKNRVIEALVKKVLTDTTACAAILTAAGLDTAVCK